MLWRKWPQTFTVESVLPPLSRLLDVRETRGEQAPEGSAWIPFSELKMRLSELPPNSESLLIADTGPEAHSAVDYLLKGNRKVSLETVGSWTNPVPHRLWAPNSFLEGFVRDMGPGRVTDFGCGAGREAVFLASLGWTVTAIDHLPEILERARSLSDRYGLSEKVSWRQANYLSPGIASNSELLTMFFFLDADILATINLNSAVGTYLLMETFTEMHFVKFGKPTPSRRISRESIQTLLSNFEVIEYEEGWRSSGIHTGRLIAQR